MIQKDSQAVVAVSGRSDRSGQLQCTIAETRYQPARFTLAELARKQVLTER